MKNCQWLKSMKLPSREEAVSFLKKKAELIWETGRRNGKAILSWLKGFVDFSKEPVKRVMGILILLAGLAMGFYFHWGIVETIIFLIFIGIILQPVSSRWLAMPALAFLITVPFLLIFKKEDLAEQFAVYAYYFLVMAVIMGIYEVRKKD